MELVMAADGGPGPDCPAWCDGQHGDQSEGIEHSRTFALVPVIAQGSSGEPVSTDFDVVRFQSVSEPAGSSSRVQSNREEWLFVGDDAGSWCVTVESAARIYRTLGTALTGVPEV